MPGRNAVAQGLPPDRLEVAGKRLPLPVISRTISRPDRFGSPRNTASTSCADLPWYKRRDQRLLDRHRPVERADVAPGLKEVGLRDVPVAKLGGLILVEPEMDAQLDLLAAQRAGEVEVRWGIVSRVRPEDHQCVDQASRMSRASSDNEPIWSAGPRSEDG